MKVAIFCQIHWLILIFKSELNFSIITAWQPWFMVAKDIFPFATMTDGCKEVNFMEFLIKFPFFVKTSKNWCPKCHIHGKIPWNLPLCNRQSRFQREKYPPQPWVMVAKDIFSFATVTDFCEEANFMGFFHYIYENELSSENMYWPLFLAKKNKKNNFISHSLK